MKLACAVALGTAQFLMAFSAHAQATAHANKDAAQEAQTAAEAARLQATLDPLAQGELTLRRLVGWSLVGTGIGGATACAYAAIKLKNSGWLYPVTGGALAAAFGFELLVETGPFEYLAQYAHQDPRHPAGTEQEWRRMEEMNRGRRRAAGAILLMDSGLSVLLGVHQSLREDETLSHEERTASADIMFGLAGIYAISGGWLLFSESPVQRALRDFWRALRSSQLGVSFRRQVPLHGFITDFYAPSARLIVEVDGGYHARRATADARRDQKLTRAGYRIIRLRAELIMRDLPTAVLAVQHALDKR